MLCKEKEREIRIVFALSFLVGMYYVIFTLLFNGLLYNDYQIPFICLLASFIAYILARG